jgi:hypothetical protein
MRSSKALGPGKETLCLDRHKRERERKPEDAQGWTRGVLIKLSLESIGCEETIMPYGNVDG